MPVGRIIRFLKNLGAWGLRLVRARNRKPPVRRHPRCLALSRSVFAINRADRRSRLVQRRWAPRLNISDTERMRLALTDGRVTWLLRSPSAVNRARRHTPTHTSSMDHGIETALRRMRSLSLPQPIPSPSSTTTTATTKSTAKSTTN